MGGASFTYPERYPSGSSSSCSSSPSKMLSFSIAGRLFAGRSLRHLDARHRPDHEVEERPGDHDQGEIADDRADGARADRTEGGRDDQQREDGLEPKHRPVARPPHADRHHPHEKSGDDDLNDVGAIAVHLRTQQVRDDHGDRYRPRDDRSGGDDQRPLASLQGLELLAHSLVSLLGPRGESLPAFDGPFLALAPLGALSLASGHQRTGVAGVSAALSARATAWGSWASRIALTTTIRRAPARATSTTFSVSIPPIANHGRSAWRAASSTSPIPVAGRPSLVGVAQTGPTLI